MDEISVKYNFTMIYGDGATDLKMICQGAAIKGFVRERWGHLRPYQAYLSDEILFWWGNFNLHHFDVDIAYFYCGTPTNFRCSSFSKRCGSITTPFLSRSISSRSVRWHHTSLPSTADHLASPRAGLRLVKYD